MKKSYKTEIRMSSIMRAQKGVKMYLDGEFVVGEDEILYGENLDHIAKVIPQRLFYYQVF